MSAKKILITITMRKYPLESDPNVLRWSEYIQSDSRTVLKYITMKNVMSDATKKFLKLNRK